MWTQMFPMHSPRSSAPKEGDLYKILIIHDCTFQLRYGYYDDEERGNPLVEPMPIYPDFYKTPQYTREGFPFVTKMQDACSCYRGKQSEFCECAECDFYSHGDDLIGICICPQHRKKSAEQNDDSK